MYPETKGRSLAELADLFDESVVPKLTYARVDASVEIYAEKRRQMVQERMERLCKVEV